MIFFAIIFWLIQYKSITVSSYVLFPGAYIQYGSHDLDVGFYSVPVVYDWNADGSKNLLVDLSTSAITGGKGEIRLFENYGADNVPFVLQFYYFFGMQ